MRETTTARPGYLIKRAQVVLHDAMTGALAPHELTVPQFAALTALGEEPGLSNADLARRAFVTPQTMHAVLQELESRQLLVRRPHPEHRRVLQAELTSVGRRTLGAAADSVDAVEDQMPPASTRLLQRRRDPSLAGSADRRNVCVVAVLHLAARTR